MARRTESDPQTRILDAAEDAIGELGFTGASLRHIASKARVNLASDFGRLPGGLETAIYRVVQEALHNCARHSQAHRVNVQVLKEASRILLSVEDDGKGFDAKRVRGLGLAGMAERVHHLGGAFHVHSRPGEGTQLEVELPLAS